MPAFPRSGLVFILSLSTIASCTGAPAPAVPAAGFRLGGLTSAARDTDKGPSLHHYTEIYERFLFQWKDDPIAIFEIGVANGGSLKMWQEYFPNATIVAADIEDKSRFDNARVKTVVADQSNRDQLRRAVDAGGGRYDVLLDDGGHTMEQQQVSLGYLFPAVKPGGFYILEDIHTSIPALWPDYGVEPGGANSTLRMIQDYMGAAPPAFRSQYMLPAEVAYLDQHVEYINLVYRTDSRSMVAIFRKKTG